MAEALADTSVYCWPGRIGVIVPPTNTVIEAKWHRMAPPGVTLHSARGALYTDTSSAEGKPAVSRNQAAF